MAVIAVVVWLKRFGGGGCSAADAMLRMRRRLRWLYVRSDAAAAVGTEVRVEVAVVVWKKQSDSGGCGAAGAVLRIWQQ